jgi:rare lipoprotein A (peptidoglycan hydrolase)
MPSYLARTGLAIFSMLLAIALLTERTAEGRALVADSSTIDLPALHEVVVTRIAFASVSVTLPTAAEAPVAAVIPAPTLVAPAAFVPAAAQNDAIVLASWYGPGFYGNRTACGQTYTPEILGVAHPTLPCGTRLTLTYGAHSIVVTVIDRGPYVAGRTLDLSNATRLALGCADLCTLRMQLGQ